jgi:uncharacterized membrane protein YqhA
MADEEQRAEGSGWGVNPEGRHRAAGLFSLIIGASQLGVIIGIVAIVLAAFAIFVYGALSVVHEFWKTIDDGWPTDDGAKHLAIVAVETADVILLGTVLNIVALGLFQLFIDPSLSTRLPGWLQVTNLDQLKRKLVGVISVLLAVTFLAAVVERGAPRDVLYLGIAVAIVIVALGLLSSVLDSEKAVPKSTDRADRTESRD